jgi:TonB family protein
MRTRRALAACCAAVVYGCTQAGGPLPTILPENFPPYGIEFHRYQAPEFPFELRATPVASGHSVVVVTIDEVGRVEDAVAIEASDPAFGRAVLAVTPEWIFAPLKPPEDASEEAATASVPEPRREVLHYRFHRSGVVSSLSHREGARALFVESSDDFARIRMVAWEELDEKPVRIEAAASDAPATRRAEGNADLSFVIDETGAVRVPTVLAASDYAIGLAALDAIKEWKFTPPRRGGEPVLVEVRARWGD